MAHALPHPGSPPWVWRRPLTTARETTSSPGERDTVGMKHEEGLLMRTILESAGQPTRAKRHERRLERRRLQRVDRLAARLADLHAVRALLERGADVIGSGWVQDAWFTVAMATAERRV